MCHFLYRLLSSNVVIGWATVVAELVVAYVIYVELSASALQNFIQRTTEPSATEDRSDIYKAFMELLKHSNLDTASKAFAEKFNTDPCLKRKCDKQIAHFNALGIAIDHWFIRGTQERRIVQIFPHAPVLLWVILGPYIKQRRLDSGSWFATPLLKFTLASATFVIENNTKGTPLRVRDSDGRVRLELSPAQIRQIKADLEIALHS